MRPRLLPTMLACAAAFAWLGCDSTTSHRAEEPTCGCECTARDPVPHCVRTQGCGSTADCPTGTVCEALPAAMQGQAFPVATGDDPLAQCGGGDGEKRCQLPRGPGGRQSLTLGFEVPSFRLLRLTANGGYAAFTWNPPEDTAIVHCALFACPPVIHETVENGLSVFEILNYPECVLASELFEPGEGVFDLADPTIEFDPGAVEGPACGTPAPRAVHELMAGCWAYDTTRILAATPLEPVSPREVFDYQSRFDLDCAAKVDGKTCAFQDTTRLGICAAGRCHAPCVTQQDCTSVPIEATDAGAGDADAADANAPADTPAQECVKNGGYVGVCMAPSSVTKEASQ